MKNIMGSSVVKENFPITKAKAIEIFSSHYDIISEYQNDFELIWTKYSNSEREYSTLTYQQFIAAFKELRLINLSKINLLQFQQPINCCNITSLAYAFSIVSGKAVTVNDIFHKANLPGWYVTHDGMTLAETYNAAIEVASDLGDIFVEVYHFDAEKVDFEGFKDSVLQDGVSTDDILISNFSVKIAHDWDHGGGHFALIGMADGSLDSEDLCLTMCEVHPLKYGKTWECSARALFNAMVDKDGDTKRARGLIRIAKHSSPRVLQKLARAKKAVCYCDPQEENSAWLSKFAKGIPADKYQMVLNMGGIAGIGLALTGLGNQLIEPDDIMRTLRLDYCEVLAKVSTSDEVIQITQNYCKVCGYPAFVERTSLGGSSNEMLDSLHSMVGPNVNNSDGQYRNSVVLLLYDINIAMGVSLINIDPNSEAARLSHFGNRWGVIIQVDVNRRVAAIADPSSKITTRIWEASIDDLWDGVQSVNSTTGVVVAFEKNIIAF